jgi:YVTN family beta-propeller protein
VAAHVVSRLPIALAGLLLIAACTREPAPDAPTSAYRVYVTNEGSGDISIIDPVKRAVIGRVALGKRPRGIIASPDQRLLYIALSGSPIAGPGVDESRLPAADKAADGIAVVDVASGKVLRVLRGISDPEQVALSPDGATLYVASEDSGRVMFMDSRTGTIRATLMVGGEPEGLAASPDGRHVYATSEEDSTIAVIDALQPRVLAHIPVGQRPRSIAFDRSGARAFVTGENDASLSVIDVAAGKVTNRMIISGETVRPMGVAVSPARGAVFVTTGRGGKLARFDAATLAPAGDAQVGERPWGVALSPDGAFAFTANGPSNDVAMVDSASMKVAARFKVGDRPWGVATVPLR